LRLKLKFAYIVDNDFEKIYKYSEQFFEILDKYDTPNKNDEITPFSIINSDSIVITCSFLNETGKIYYIN